MRLFSQSLRRMKEYRNTPVQDQSTMTSACGSVDAQTRVCRLAKHVPMAAFVRREDLTDASGWVACLQVGVKAETVL